MNNKIMNNALLVLSVSAVLTACGGGSTSSGTNGTSDEVAPVITLNGSSNISILINSDYQDAGATANDDVDGSVTITQIGAVDTSISGNYIIAYNAVDAAGNAADEVIRTVSVVNGRTIVVPQKLYNIQYAPSDGFDFRELSLTASSISNIKGTVENGVVTFEGAPGDLYFSASAGEWVGRNPSNFGFELAESDTVGIINGIRKLAIEDIESIAGQHLIVGTTEIDDNLPEGSARYVVNMELLDDLYSIEGRVLFNNVVAQTLDEVLSEGCDTVGLLDSIDSAQLSDAIIPCSQINQTSGTLTANNASGAVVANAGIWSVGKIPGSEIDVLTVKFNPSFLRAGSTQLTKHEIFAIKDGEAWVGDMTVQGVVTREVYYNEIAVDNRILSGCFTEDSSGRYLDC